MARTAEQVALEREVEIAASPETVWGFLVDPEKQTALDGAGRDCSTSRQGGAYRWRSSRRTSRAASSSRSTRRGGSCTRGAGSRTRERIRTRCRRARRRSRSTSSRLARVRGCASCTATCRRPRQRSRTRTAGITTSSGCRPSPAEGLPASTRGCPAGCRKSRACRNACVLCVRQTPAARPLRRWLMAEG